MDNTEKLLRAFIEASGYEVEEVLLPSGVVGAAEYHGGIDYKVTKKESTQQEKDFLSMSEIIAHSEAWGAIVEYVTDHDDDIEIGINDFSTLRPVLDFFNRNS